VGGVVALVWLGSAVAGNIVGHQNGRAILGTFLGLFFGPLGVLVVAIVPPTPEIQARRLAMALAVVPPRAASVPEEIALLAKLRDDGNISESEFQAKKADLLDRM
jgi:hypothetical protein